MGTFPSILVKFSPPTYSSTVIILFLLLFLFLSFLIFFFLLFFYPCQDTTIRYNIKWHDNVRNKYLSRLPDFRKADFEGFKKYLQVFDWQLTGGKNQVRFWMDKEGERLDEE